MSPLLSVLFFLATALFGVLSWQKPSWGVRLIAVCAPIYLIRLAFFELPLTLLELWIVVLFLLTVKKFPLSTWWKTLQGDRFTPFLVAWIVLGLVAASTSPDLRGGFGLWKAYVVEPVLFFAVVRTWIITESDRLKTMWSLGWGSLLVSLFAAAQWIFDRWVPVPWDVERRVTSVFPFPNAVGLWLGPISILMLGVALKEWEEAKEARRRPWKAVVALFITGSAWCAIWWSKSEAALLSIAICIGIVLWVWIKHQRFHQARWIAVALILPIIYIATKIKTLQPLLEKVLLQDSSGQTRLFIWQETFAFLRDHWFFGAGLGGYPKAIIPYHAHTFLERFQYPHQIFLNVWVELGLIGLTLTLCGMILFWRSRRLDPPWITFWISLVFVQMMIHGLVDVPYFKNDLAVLCWTLAALFVPALCLPTPVPRSLHVKN